MPSRQVDAERGRTVVCDNGTGFVKCGFSGDNFPTSVFPCLVGRPVLRYEGIQGTDALAQDIVVGACCAAQRNDLELSYPISEGVVQSWDDMSHVYDHTFRDVLNVEPTDPDSKILLTSPPLNPTANRLRMMEIMLESYGFSGLNIQVQAVLALYAQGLLTGIVLDSGDGVTHSVPVVDGYSLPHLTKRINLAGRHITSYLVELMRRRGYEFNRSADFETVRQLKEQMCFCALDYAQELKLARETTYLVQKYTLPDGRSIRVSAERFMAPEALFTPKLIDKESVGISEMVFDCIQENAMDNRMRLYHNIVLSGGSTMYNGLPARMEHDIKSLYLERVLQGNKEGMRKLKLKVHAPPRRKHMVFLGAAILADIMKDDTSGNFWVSKQDWQEDPHRALRKCDGLGGNR